MISFWLLCHFDSIVIKPKYQYQMIFQTLVLIKTVVWTWTDDTRMQLQPWVLCMHQWVALLVTCLSCSQHESFIPITHLLVENLPTSVGTIYTHYKWINFRPPPPTWAKDVVTSAPLACVVLLQRRKREGLTKTLTCTDRPWPRSSFGPVQRWDLESSPCFYVVRSNALFGC